jgi:hypothetical protein
MARQSPRSERIYAEPREPVEVIDKGTMLVNVRPPRMVERVLVVDNTRGIHHLRVHVQADNEGTLFVQVTDG